MWEVHDQVAHFEVDTIGGGRCRYRDLWQQRQLLLVCVPPGGTDSDAWLARLAGREQELASMETALVVTNQPIPGALPGVSSLPIAGARSSTSGPAIVPMRRGRQSTT